MAQTADLATITTVTVKDTVLDIFTYYDQSFNEFLQFFIVEILGVVNAVNFAEGELGYSVDNMPDFSANVNDNGELVVTDDDTDPYFIDNDGYLINGDILPAPGLDAETGITDNGFTINYGTVAGATGYCVDVSTDPQFDTYVTGYQNLDIALALTLAVSGLSAGITYYYRVRAYDGNQTSLDSVIGSVTTVSDITTISDKDGNVYHTVQIGALLVTVENLKVTHYADGTPIPIKTINTSPNQVTVWNNVDFDTFIVSGANITSAIKAAEAYGHAVSNVMTLTTNDIISGYFNITNNSGTPGTLALLKGGVLYSWITLNPAGGNTIAWLIPEDNTYQLMFISSNVGTDLSAVVFTKTLVNSGWNDDTLGAMCWMNNDIINKPVYGGLYNWPAMQNAHGFVYFERSGVPEAGWRIPLDADWNTIIATAGGGSVAGGKLKEVGLVHWQAPNVGATDDYGFTALPGGGRQGDTGAFHSFGDSSSFKSGSATGKELSLVSETTVAILQFLEGFANFGYSIRCVKDV